MKTKLPPTSHPVSQPARMAKAVLQEALHRLVRESDPYPPIRRKAAQLFVSEDEPALDWTAEQEAWSALQLAVLSLRLDRDGEIFRSRLKSWWSSASTEARRQAVKIALGICER